MDWVQIISSLGFPIAMCAALCWYINRKDERTDKTLASLTRAITELSEQIREILRKDV